MFLPVEIQWKILKETMFPPKLPFDSLQFFKLYFEFPKTMARYAVNDKQLICEFETNRTFHRHIAEYICQDTGIFFLKFYKIINWGETIHRYITLDERILEDYLDYIDWKSLLKHQQLSDEFILKYWHNVQLYFETFQKYQDLSMELLRRFKYIYDWEIISFYQSVTLEVATEFENHLDWYRISERDTIEPLVLTTFRDRLDWTRICQNINMLEVLDYQQILELENYINWTTLAMWHASDFSQEQIAEYFHFFDIKALLNYAHFSEEMLNIVIRECTLTPLDWNIISNCQVLSEEFISENLSSVNISIICQQQSLSQEFISKYHFLLDWRILCQFQYVSEWSTKFIEKFKDNIRWYCMFENKHLLFSSELDTFKKLYSFYAQPIVFE